MRTTYILICLAVALAIIAAGGLAFRAASRGAGDAARAQRACAWFATLFGFALVGAIAVAHLTGRFGAERLWFRAPTFYVAAAILLAGVVTWLRRPAPAAVRFGLPAVVLGLAGGAALILRLTGNSAPIAMSMPTMSQAAPALSYFDTDGKLHALADFKGKVVLLNFWATWCTPCRREMPLLSKLQGEHANDGLVVLYLSLEEPGVLTEFLRKNRFDGVHGRLADAAPFYNAGKFYPLSYLISREGRVEKRWSGRPTEQWIDSAIREELKPAG
ncbi:MAG TPA: redoxin domain-containing protein [Steroidobacteraceae bacterium]|nr:redoxin domain-containing protein [Steroidobacteraceae bacterium]